MAKRAQFTDKNGNALNPITSSMEVYHSSDKTVSEILTELLSGGGKKSVGYINAIDYGFSNDGSTDNSEVMDKYIEENSETRLHFPAGTYCFSREIHFLDHVYITLEGNAAWKLTQSSTRFLSFDTTTDAGPRDCFFRGGTIDGNDLCDICIQIGGMKYFDFSPKVIKNFAVNGISTDKISTYYCSGVMVNRSLIVNENPKIGTLAINDLSNDNWYTNIVIRDVEQGIFTTSSKFLNIHHWIKDQSLIENSLFAFINGRAAKFSDCTVDTLRKAFDGKDWCWAGITNLTVLFNTKFYTSDYFDQFPPCLFNNVAGVTYLVSNMTLKYDHDMRFADEDVDGTDSCFSNTKLHNEVGSSISITNAPSSLKEDVAALKAKFEGAIRSLDGSSDFDAQTSAGVYYLNTYNGSGGVNVPSSAYGTMCVMYTAQVITQTVYTKDKILSRRYDQNGWSSWVSITLS